MSECFTVSRYSGRRKRANRGCSNNSVFADTDYAVVLLGGSLHLVCAICVVTACREVVCISLLPGCLIVKQRCGA